MRVRERRGKREWRRRGRREKKKKWIWRWI